MALWKGLTVKGRLKIARYLEMGSRVEGRFFFRREYMRIPRDGEEGDGRHEKDT